MAVETKAILKILLNVGLWESEDSIASAFQSSD
jgi:hypothetical protein